MSEEKEIHCSICGKTADETTRLYQGRDENFYVCYDCANTIARNYRAEEQREKQRRALENKDGVVTPVSIKKFLDQYIIGQDHAKEVLATAVYNHSKMLRIKDQDMSDVEIEKSNIILAGPTGCGKTAMLKALAKFLDVPFAIGDSTALTAAGYVGEDVETVIRKLVDAADGDIEKAERGIIYIDEIDKISRKGENLSTTSDPGHEEVQQALLKIIEGSEVEVPVKGQRKHPQGDTYKVNTENILFVVGGAFEGIERIIMERMNRGKGMIGFGGDVVGDNKDYNDFIDNLRTEDLRKFGMLPEFLGRLPIVCTMKELTKSQLVQVLKEPKNALLKQYSELFRADDMRLDFDDEALGKVADMAIERKTGARGLRSIMEETLGKVMFEAPGHNYSSIRVLLDENNEFKIERRVFRKAS